MLRPGSLSPVLPAGGVGLWAWGKSLRVGEFSSGLNMGGNRLTHFCLFARPCSDRQCCAAQVLVLLQGLQPCRGDGFV